MNKIRANSVKTILIALFITCYIAQPLFSQDYTPVEFATGEAYTLTSAVTKALENNRQILIEKENNKVLKAGVSKEVTNFFPTLKTDFGFTYNTVIEKTSISGGSFSSIDKSQTQTQVTVSQPITDFYRTFLRKGVAKKDYEISLFEMKLRNDEIVDSVTREYLDIIKQKRVLEVNIKNIEKLEGYYKEAMNLYDTGLALSRDALKIKVELENAKQNLFQEENTYKIQMMKLKYLMGIDLAKSIVIDHSFEPVIFIDKSIEDLQDIALRNRPEVLQGNSSVEQGRIDKKLKFSEYIPDITFFGTYVNITGSRFTPSNNYIFGVSASYSLWDWGNRYYGVKQAEYELKKRNIQLEDTKNQIFIELQTQLNKVNETKRLIDVSKKNVEYSRESLRISENRFKAGLGLVIELIDDQTSFLESELTQISSELEYQKGLIELKKLLGVLSSEINCSIKNSQLP